MGQVSSALDPTGGQGAISVPEGYTTPSFPSLYIPTIVSTIQQRGIYLYEAEVIWRFTLYWTLLMIGVLFFLCASLASLSLLLSLTVFWPDTASSSKDDLPLDPLKSPTSTPLVSQSQRKKRGKRKRPPLWPVFLIPFIALALAAFISVFTATIVGFAIAAIYSAGGFSMATWIPFLWALIQVLVLIISPAEELLEQIRKEAYKTGSKILTMGNLIWHQWGRLLAITSAVYLVWASFWAFFFRKFFWDMIGGTLGPAGIIPGSGSQIFVKLIVDAPVLQSLTLVHGLIALAVELPLPFIGGTAIHRSFVMRAVLYLITGFVGLLVYQTVNAGIYFLITSGVYTVAMSKGEVMADPNKSKGRGEA